MPKFDLNSMNPDAIDMLLRVRHAVRSSGHPRAHRIGDADIALAMMETIRVLEATFKRLTREA